MGSRGGGNGDGVITSPGEGVKGAKEGAAKAAGAQGSKESCGAGDGGAGTAPDVAAADGEERAKELLGCPGSIAVWEPIALGDDRAVRVDEEEAVEDETAIGGAEGNDGAGGW